MQKRKLIEVSLPLEAINRESAREKSIRHGHPSTLHLWWARRPLAAARAVLFAQLVDDPSARPEEFPTEEAQRRERERLHDLIERLVVWENTRDEKLLAEAHAEILKSTNGNPPPILDPFAGGGTIPLEAQRLGLEAHASDLNPVAVLINKALIEIPPKFRDQPPVFPGLADTRNQWKGAEGLSADVRAYGQWMRDEAKQRIGHLYPDATLPDGTSAPVIAWLWARTVACPNPACGIEMPLVRSWWLGKKKGKEAYIAPVVVRDPTHPSGNRVAFDIRHDPAQAHQPGSDGTVSRTGSTCVACQTPVSLDHIRAEGRAKRMSARLIAVVAEGQRRRIYLPADSTQVDATEIDRPITAPDQSLATHPQYMGTPRYGLDELSDLFTNRQLTSLVTLSDLVIEARELAHRDALSAGRGEGFRLSDSGDAGAAYADAVATYLGFSVSKSLARNNTMCTWETGMDRLRGSFQRQAMPMTWDFAEANPLTTTGGGFAAVVQSEFEVLDALVSGQGGHVTQADAATRSYQGLLISTDPPYYDNVPYSDLSDFFYPWLRKALLSVHPAAFSTLLAPKNQELVANSQRQGGKNGAREFFETGFRSVFGRARETALSDYPISVYYAFKQSEESEDGTSFSGWETLLEGMIRSGWAITATWPIRSELESRSRNQGANALASSIVLSLRPRAEDASTTDRRGLIAALEAELPGALRRLEQGQVSPVDLPQAAIGPGMAVFSRYAGVLEPDGSKMTVRAALARINEILDQVLNEQEGDFDTTTRFALAWYRQHGYAVGKFGDADNLARARNTSIDLLDRDGILTSRAGNVQLLKAADLPADYDVTLDGHTSTWEALHHLVRVLELDGISPAGEFLQAALARRDGAVDADLVKELAHLLFRIAEGNNATKDALSFNALVTSWPEVMDVARAQPPVTVVSQATFDFDEEGA